MKKIGLILCLCIVSLMKLSAQIPNNGFENWISYGTYEEPVGWATTNFMSPGTFYPATKSTDHDPEGVGSYSLKVENNISLLPNYAGAGGVINAPFGPPHPNFPLSCNPDYMSGYYKFFPLNGDTLHVRLTLFNLGLPVAFLDFNTTENQPEWKYFRIDIHDSIVADSGHIVVAAYHAIGSLDTYTPYGNSVAYFDNFNLNSVKASSTITENACGSYVAPDGAVYTTSGIKTAVIPNYNGCDSTITINLTINNVDIVVNQNSNILTANASSASYQWLDCNNNFSHLLGETGQVLNSSKTGSFAVEITQNNCTDTSLCYDLSTVGVLDNTFNNLTGVYPNPTPGEFTIDLGAVFQEVTVIIIDNNGRLVQTKTLKDTQHIHSLIKGAAGLYTITILADGKKGTLHLVKN